MQTDHNNQTSLNWTSFDRKEQRTWDIRSKIESFCHKRLATASRMKLRNSRMNVSIKIGTKNVRQ